MSTPISGQYPVSIKGVVFTKDQVILLKNERDEFELPGGRLESNEHPEECVKREIQEELNLEVNVIKILDAWLYTISSSHQVLIVTYGCQLIHEDIHQMQISHEHKEIGLFSLSELQALRMPENYKKSILAWAEHG